MYLGTLGWFRRASSRVLSGSAEADYRECFEDGAREAEDEGEGGRFMVVEVEPDGDERVAFQGGYVVCQKPLS